MKPIIIIGAGHAGLTLAREIRTRESQRPITIISQEAICAYYKPNLSKALSMNKTADELITKSADELAAQLDARLISWATITKIDTQIQAIEWTEKNGMRCQLDYHALVFATGANPIRLPSSVCDEEDILSINNLADYQRFREAIRDKKSVAIIGGGFIGCELASDLRQNSYDVHIVERGEWPLQRAIPEIMGSTIRQQMNDDLIQWHLGCSVESIQSENGRKILHLNNHQQIACDIVVSAIGLRPNTLLAQLAGIDVGIGIQVGAYSQTSAKHVYALGDCAEYAGQSLPFIAPASHAAKALASTLCADPTPLHLPAMAVPVKIAACPTVICINQGQQGIWEVQGSGMDLEAHYLNAHGDLIGFALTGKCISKKVELLRTIEENNVLEKREAVA